MKKRRGFLTITKEDVARARKAVGKDKFTVTTMNRKRSVLYKDLKAVNKFNDRVSKRRKSFQAWLKRPLKT